MTPHQLINYIETNGGYINPSLNILVGEEAEFGVVSLSGVKNNSVSIKVPYSLEEYYNKQGIWYEFMLSLGVDLSVKENFNRHSVKDFTLPLICAANHSFENPGRLVRENNMWVLYGSTLCYSKSRFILKDRWGIVEQ